MPRLSLALALLLIAAPAAHAADQPDYKDDRSTPEAVLRSFYNALDRKEYLRAWSYYQDGDGVPALSEFEKGYADTASVAIKLGTSTSEGAAGSVYYTVPAVLDATHTDGKHEFFAGCFTLRLVQPAIQEKPPFQPLHIVSGKLKTAKSAELSEAPASCDN